jgi:hypothetical protein
MLGETWPGSWSILQNGSQLTIETGDTVSYPVYRGSLNGLRFDFMTSDFDGGGVGSCRADFTGTLAGSFSADGRRLEAFETWIFRYSSGAESTITVHWIGSSSR